MFSPAFTMWLYLAEDQHPGALIAKSLWVPVDPDPEPELSAKIDTEEKGNDDDGQRYDRTDSN